MEQGQKFRCEITRNINKSNCWILLACDWTLNICRTAFMLAELFWRTLCVFDSIEVTNIHWTQTDQIIHSMSNYLLFTWFQMWS